MRMGKKITVKIFAQSSFRHNFLTACTFTKFSKTETKKKQLFQTSAVMVQFVLCTHTSDQNKTQLGHSDPVWAVHSHST